MKTKTKKTTKQPKGPSKAKTAQAAAEAAAREATRKQLDVLETASMAAKTAAFNTTIEHLRAVWQAKGLGDGGVIVTPKSWAAGPETFRALGLLKFTTSFPERVIIQQSTTEAVSALLDTKDQSSEVREFLHIYQNELALLGTLPLWS